MLNKLLKRCMPWMDKGRWYHIRITSTDDVRKVECDDIFEVVSFTDTTLKISFKNPGIYTVIDVKVTNTPLNYDPSSYTPSVIVLNPYKDIHLSGNKLDIPVGTDNIFKWEYWLFVTR